jgi:O-antigen/teichoic acid export membrane protein
LLSPLGFRLSWGQVRQVLRGSFPFAMIMLLYGLNEKVDMVMLERLASKSETGIYAAAYRWSDAVMMYLWTVLPVFFARFAATAADRGAQQQLIRVGQVLVTVPLLFVGLFVFYYGRLLFWQFDNSSTQQLQRMELNLILLFVQVVVQGFFALYSTLLTASNYEKPVGRLVALSVILNVMLNSILIPAYGSVAAAANTLLCSGVVAAGYLYLVNKKMGLALPMDILLKLCGAGLVGVGAFQLLHDGPLAWYWNTAIAGMAYTGVLVLLRILTPKDLALLKQPHKPGPPKQDQDTTEAIGRCF